MRQDMDDLIQEMNSEVHGEGLTMLEDVNEVLEYIENWESKLKQRKKNLTTIKEAVNG